MSSTTGTIKQGWNPVMTANTTIVSYWLNWRFCICVLELLILMVISWIIIWRNENHRKEENDDSGDNKQESKVQPFYEDETWLPSLKGVHPAWLLIFRLLGFSVLLILLISSVKVNGPTIYYYYTQWTCTLVTIYFGLGSLLSIHGCVQYHKRVGGDKVGNFEVDAEQGVSPRENSDSHGSVNVRRPAGKLAHAFQIIFQISGGAVMLTDCVFWFILVPFLAIKDIHLSTLVVSMHSMNALFLYGDAAMNCLRVPWFRISYFFMWTITYVIFQWILHASFSLWWPYPFLDLSSSYAPLWYLCVAVMQIPCYGIFTFTIKMKHKLFSKWFPDSYQCLR